MKEFSKHKLVLGKAGVAMKTITMKETNFRKELAPTDAKIDKLEINGENFITIEYEYKLSET